ncbi:MAG: hypothetical protein J6K97_01515, partial [Clostridia bacterium]|nr:hypothetical protein [Clostridia bacterium]
VTNVDKTVSDTAQTTLEYQMKSGDKITLNVYPTYTLSEGENPDKYSVVLKKGSDYYLAESTIVEGQVETAVGKYLLNSEKENEDDLISKIEGEFPISSLSNVLYINNLQYSPAKLKYSERQGDNDKTYYKYEEDLVEENCDIVSSIVVNEKYEEYEFTVDNTIIEYKEAKTIYDFTNNDPFGSENPIKSTNRGQYSVSMLSDSNNYSYQESDGTFTFYAKNIKENPIFEIVITNKEASEDFVAKGMYIYVEKITDQVIHYAEADDYDGSGRVEIFESEGKEEDWIKRGATKLVFGNNISPLSIVLNQDISLGLIDSSYVKHEGINIIGNGYNISYYGNTLYKQLEGSTSVIKDVNLLGEVNCLDYSDNSFFASEGGASQTENSEVMSVLHNISLYGNIKIKNVNIGLINNTNIRLVNFKTFVNIDAYLFTQHVNLLNNINNIHYDDEDGVYKNNCTYNVADGRDGYVKGIAIYSAGDTVAYIYNNELSTKARGKTDGFSIYDIPNGTALALNRKGQAASAINILPDDFFTGDHEDNLKDYDSDCFVDTTNLCQPRIIYGEESEDGRDSMTSRAGFKIRVTSDFKTNANAQRLGSDEESNLFIAEAFDKPSLFEGRPNNYGYKVSSGTDANDKNFDIASQNYETNVLGNSVIFRFTSNDRTGSASTAGLIDINSGWSTSSDNIFGIDKDKLTESVTVKYNDQSATVRPHLPSYWNTTFWATVNTKDDEEGLINAEVRVLASKIPFYNGNIEDWHFVGQWTED